VPPQVEGPALVLGRSLPGDFDPPGRDRQRALFRRVGGELVEHHAERQCIGGLETDGIALRKVDLPVAPLVLGLILGPFIEESLRTSLEMSGGDFSIFYTRPLCLALLLIAGVVLVGSTLRLPPAVREQDL
jgi:hypothetical protein